MECSWTLVKAAGHISERRHSRLASSVGVRPCYSGSQAMIAGRGVLFLASWCVLLALTERPIGAVEVVSTWDGSTGNWSDATKWSSNPLYPNNGNGGED